MWNRWFGAVLLLLASALPGAAAPVRTPHVEAELVSELRGIRPGQDFWIALRLEIIPHWHTYWINPGDSGLATRVELELEPGLEAGDIVWPHPVRIEAGPLVSYGYEGEVLHLIPVRVTDELASETALLRARASWLVCEEVCLPEEAELELELPVDVEVPDPDPRWVEDFARARAKVPLEDAGWSFEAWRRDGLWAVRATPPAWFEGSIEHARFFPDRAGLIADADPQEWRFDPEAGAYWLKLRDAVRAGQSPAELRGVLVGDGGWRGVEGEPALRVVAPVVEGGDAPVAMELSPTPAPAIALAGGGGEAKRGGPLVEEVVATAGSALGFAGAIAFAFVGGLLLNLMPCVFPVISLKVMGFVQHAQEDHRQVWKHGVAFAVGVLLSFWVVAGALLGLRAAGAEIGWGFQLQSPAVLVALASLFFLLALNLFGVFELGTSLTRLANQSERAHGLAASFASGCLATLVATPCSAPLMGAALGYALVQPAWVAMVVFTSLGLGMALPYLVLASSPRLLSRIPRPGPWMETLRQTMGFLFLATVVWLGWVLERQVGDGAIVSLLGILWLLALAGWVAGRWGAMVRRLPVRVIARVVAMMLIVAGGALAWRDIVSPAAHAGTVASPAAVESSAGWQPWSAERVDELLAAGEPVFVDFTAAWCLSCQVNKRVALDTPGVRERFEELGVTRLKADWTNRDPEITRALAAFGRSGVPLYVLYGSDPQAAPEILPELLTPGLVLDALERVAG